MCGMYISEPEFPSVDVSKGSCEMAGLAPVLLASPVIGQLFLALIPLQHPHLNILNVIQFSLLHPSFLMLHKYSWNACVWL